MQTPNNEPKVLPDVLELFINDEDEPDYDALRGYLANPKVPERRKQFFDEIDVILGGESEVTPQQISYWSNLRLPDDEAVRQFLQALRAEAERDN